MIVQGSAEWKLDRAGKVGCSALNHVMASGKGEKPSATREDYMMDLLCERLSGEPSDNFVSRYMEEGTENEPLAKALYEARTGAWITDHPGKCHPTILGWRGSPDGLIDDGNGSIEAKCPKVKTHLATVLKGTIKRDYILQMAGIVDIFERDWIDFISYCPKLPDNLCLYIRRFTRAELPIDEVRSGVIQFLKELDELESRVRSIGG